MNLRIEVVDNLNNIFIKDKIYEIKVYSVDNNVESNITNNTNLNVYSTNYDTVFLYRKNENDPFKILLKKKGRASLVFVYKNKRRAMSIVFLF